MIYKLQIALSAVVTFLFPPEAETPDERDGLFPWTEIVPVVIILALLR